MRPCSGVVHLARVHVHVIALVVDVVCLMLVLSALVVLHAVFVVFPWPVFCSRRYTLYKRSAPSSRLGSQRRRQWVTSRAQMPLRKKHGSLPWIMSMRSCAN